MKENDTDMLFFITYRNPCFCDASLKIDNNLNILTVS